MKVFVLMSKDPEFRDFTDLEGVFSSREKAETKREELRGLYVYKGSKFSIWPDDLDGEVE